MKIVSIHQNIVLPNLQMVGNLSQLEASYLQGTG